MNKKAKEDIDTDDLNEKKGAATMGTEDVKVIIEGEEEPGSRLGCTTGGGNMGSKLAGYIGAAGENSGDTDEEKRKAGEIRVEDIE